MICLICFKQITFLHSALERRLRPEKILLFHFLALPATIAGAFVSSVSSDTSLLLDTQKKSSSVSDSVESEASDELLEMSLTSGMDTAGGIS
jgi:hypothetical protein